MYWKNNYAYMYYQRLLMINYSDSLTYKYGIVQPIQLHVFCK